MIKLIASDMDGTLVNSQHRISEENVNAIKLAQSMGIEFIITTGRAYEDAVSQVQEAGIECNYLVMNGSELRNSQGDILQTLYMNPALVEEVIKRLEEENLYIELYTTKGTYSISNAELCKWATATKINFFFPQISIEEAYITVEEHEQFLKIKRCASIEELYNMGAEVGKIVSFSSDLKKLARLREELPLTLGASTTGSFPINLEITDPNANKGEAIKRYALSKGVAMEEIMTIGDSFNDLSMLSENFGYTVAMGNAIDEIKAVAKYVTTSNDHHGVSTVIKKHIQIEGILKR